MKPVYILVCIATALLSLILGFSSDWMALALEFSKSLFVELLAVLLVAFCLKIR
jgi:hypothetical protein